MTNDSLINIFSLIVLLFSAIIHEIAHGGIAGFLGDNTARDSGRLSLNPLKHLDPFGSIILPLFLYVSYTIIGVRGFIFGWAKPVPINPYNLRDKKWGILKVSLAGPFTNIIIGLFFGLIIRFISLPGNISILFGIISFINFLLAVFNLIPIPPLDGSHILFFLLGERSRGLREMLVRHQLVILLLFIFLGLNLVYGAAIFLYGIVAGQGAVL